MLFFLLLLFLDHQEQRIMPAMCPRRRASLKRAGRSGAETFGALFSTAGFAGIADDDGEQQEAQRRVFAGESGRPAGFVPAGMPV